LMFGASLVFVDAIVVLVIGIVYVVFFLDGIGVILFFFFVIDVVVVVGEFEFERGIAGYAQEGTALRAGQFVADVDVVFVDINGRIALGTNRGHAGGSLAAERRTVQIITRT
jgi:hypothetical protein